MQLINACDTIETVPCLIQAAHEAWELIEQVIHEKSAAVDRVEAEVAARDWYTGY